VPGEATPQSARSEFEQLLRKLVFEVAAETLDEAKPHIKRWVTKTAVPAAASAGTAVASTVGAIAASAWRKVAGTGPGDDRIVRVESRIGPAAVEVGGGDPSDEVAAAIEAYRGGLSKAEARQRIVAALAPDPVGEAAVTLTEKQLGESIQLMIESTPSLLDERVLRDLRTILEADPPM